MTRLTLLSEKILRVFTVLNLSIVLIVFLFPAEYSYSQSKIYNASPMPHSRQSTYLIAQLKNEEVPSGNTSESAVFVETNTPSTNANGNLNDGSSVNTDGNLDLNIDLPPVGAIPENAGAGGMNQDSEDLGAMAMAMKVISAIAGVIFIVIGGFICAIVFPITCIIGAPIIGMGLMMLAQAAADSEGQSASDAVNGATSVRMPTFPKGYNPLDNLDFDQLQVGRGIFAKGGGGQTVDGLIDEYRNKGYSYDSNTKLMTTPYGTYKGSDYESIEGLMGMGMTKEQARKVMGIGKAIHRKAANGDFGKIPGKKPGKKGKKKIKVLKESFVKPSRASVDLEGDEGAQKLTRPNFNLLKTKNSILRRKGALEKKGPKKARLYYGTPIGERGDDIFGLINRAYSRKNAGTYFVQGKYGK